MPEEFPLPPTPPDGEDYCRVPYMYVDPVKGRDRLRYFSIHKYLKMQGADYKIEPAYFISTADFFSLLKILFYEDKLGDCDQVRIYFALYDDTENIPKGSENSFAFIFASTEPDDKGNYVDKNYYIVDPGHSPSSIVPVSQNYVRKWVGNYRKRIRPKLDETLYHDGSHPSDSPTDTNSIDYDFLGLCQIYRELDFQKYINNITTLTGIELFLSSFRGKTDDPRRAEYPCCYPQRLFTEIRLIEEIGNRRIEFNLAESPHFDERQKEERPDKCEKYLRPGPKKDHELDTGNICPPRCGGSIWP